MTERHEECAMDNCRSPACASSESAPLRLRPVPAPDLARFGANVIRVEPIGTTLDRCRRRLSATLFRVDQNYLNHSRRAGPPPRCVAASIFEILELAYFWEPTPATAPESGAAAARICLT